MLFDAGGAMARRRRPYQPAHRPLSSHLCSTSVPLSIGTPMVSSRSKVSSTSLFYGDSRLSGDSWKSTMCGYVLLRSFLPTYHPPPSFRSTNLSASTVVTKLLSEDPHRHPLSFTPQPHLPPTIFIKLTSGVCGIPLGLRRSDLNTQSWIYKDERDFLSLPCFDGQPSAIPTASPPPPSLLVLGRCSISQSLSSWDLGALQPCVSGVPLLTKASDLCRVLLQTSSPPSAITSSTLSKPYINDFPWESEAVLIPLLMLSVFGGFTGVLFVRMVLYSACVKSSPMRSSDSVIYRTSSSFGETFLPPYSSPTERDGFSDLLPSVCFRFLIGLYSCVAVSTGPEDAIESTLVFFVDEVWTLTSHYVTIVHLLDSVVKAHPTHSSTVLNSLSSSIEDLSYLAYLSVVVYVYCQR